MPTLLHGPLQLAAVDAPELHHHKPRYKYQHYNPGYQYQHHNPGYQYQHHNPRYQYQHYNPRYQYKQASEHHNWNQRYQLHHHHYHHHQQQRIVEEQCQRNHNGTEKSAGFSVKVTPLYVLALLLVISQAFLWFIEKMPWI
uniref:CX domain-containing protein n=1 Tax=Globodera pallida TaxID=36090 RepID=A0A183BKV3_GLOPA